jgi:Glyoxalase-like domain
VPLGGGYLAVLGVANPKEAANSEFGRGLLTRLARGGEGWLAWVVAVQDVGPAARRLGTTITTLKREGLSARLTGVEQAMKEPLLPFFISRDLGVADPGVGGDAGGITWIALAGDAARLERWLDSIPLPVRVVEGPPAVLAIGIDNRTFRERL